MDIISRIKFCALYAKQTIRDTLISFLGLTSLYEDDKLIINYFHRGEFYQIVVPREKKMCPFKKVETHILRDNSIHHGETDDGVILDFPLSSASDEVSELCEEIRVVDVTRDIKRMIGPHYDFHKIHTTPHMLGYNNLVFYRKNGDRVKYSKFANITI